MLTVREVVDLHLFVAQLLDVLDDAVDAVSQLSLFVQQNVDSDFQLVQRLLVC